MPFGDTSERMATITLNIHPGPNGPIYVVQGSTGHTLVINDYMHPDAGAGAAVTDANGRRGKQTSQSV